jgi:hypothetical protein
MLEFAAFLEDYKGFDTLEPSLTPRPQPAFLHLPRNAKASARCIQKEGLPGCTTSRRFDVDLHHIWLHTDGVFRGRK